MRAVARRRLWSDLDRFMAMLEAIADVWMLPRQAPDLSLSEAYMASHRNKPLKDGMRR